MRTARHAAAVTTIASLLLAGCSLEPHLARPAPLVPAGWPAGDAYLRQSEAALPALSYTDIFRDPKLQRLIERALAGSQDLAAAVATVAQAHATYRVARADRLPTIDAGAGATIQRSNGSTGDSYRANIGLSSFEIDLFGRLRSLSRASFHAYLSTEAGARSTRLALVAEIADAYLTYAADRDLLVIARDTVASAGRSVQLTRARLEGGIAPRTDLSAAQTTLAGAEGDVAELTAAIAQDRNALDLLIGTPVADGDLPGSLAETEGLLAELPAGLDSTILLRRPDVMQAEYTLRAANARIGAARAAFFPTISLTGLIGFASNALGSLFSGSGFAWSVAPSATQTIFDGGGRAGGLDYARATRDLAVADYQRAIQGAFRDVADALATRGTIDARVGADRRAVAAANDTYVLSDASYRGGVTAFLQTLVAQRELYAARRTLVDTRLAKAQNLVELYRALGGDRLIADRPIEGNRTLAPAAPSG